MNWKKVAKHYMLGWCERHFCAPWLQPTPESRAGSRSAVSRMACIDSARHGTANALVATDALPRPRAVGWAGLSWIGQRRLLSRDRRFVIDVIASFPYDEILEGDQSELKSSKVPKRLADVRESWVLPYS